MITKNITLLQVEPQKVQKIPSSWSWFIDYALTSYVKKNYSKQGNWKDKPFSKQDALFFLKGIRELSDLFTEERSSRKMFNYLDHGRFRSSYLLYFLPLQAAKFCSLFSRHLPAIDAAFNHGVKKKKFTVLDLGSGPATASISLLLHLIENKKLAQVPFDIEIHLVDKAKHTLEDGKELIQKIAEQFPKFKNKITVKTYQADCRTWIKKNPIETSLVLVGHLLNEGAEFDYVLPLFAHARGGGLLFMEPAARSSSQKLSQLRNLYFGDNPEHPLVWGPCLHAGICPMSEGRDWCHFSLPAKFDSEWFSFFSKGLTKEKEWLKFSYIWFSAPDYPAPATPSDHKLVLTDLLSKNPKAASSVLLCDPEVPLRLNLKPGVKIWRGDQVKVRV